MLVYIKDTIVNSDEVSCIYSSYNLEFNEFRVLFNVNMKNGKELHIDCADMEEYHRLLNNLFEQIRRE